MLGISLTHMLGISTPNCADKQAFGFQATQWHTIAVSGYNPPRT